MNVMRHRDIQQILTNDRRFSQEGFVRLLDLKA
jgi:predicted nucleic acid-binding protein